MMEGGEAAGMTTGGCTSGQAMKQCEDDGM